MLMDNRLKRVPLLVFANKQDLPNAMTASEVAEGLGLVRLEERTWEIKACTAVDGTGIKEGMDWVCKNMKKQLRLAIIFAIVKCKKTSQKRNISNRYPIFSVFDYFMYLI